MYLSWIHTYISKHTYTYLRQPCTSTRHHSLGLGRCTTLHPPPAQQASFIIIQSLKEVLYNTISLSSCQPSASYVSCLPNARRRRYFKAREAADSLLRETAEVAAIGVWCVMWIHNILLSFRIFLSPYVVCLQFTYVTEVCDCSYDFFFWSSNVWSIRLSAAEGAAERGATSAINLNEVCD